MSKNDIEQKITYVKFNTPPIYNTLFLINILVQKRSFLRLYTQFIQIYHNFIHNHWG